MSNRKKIRRKVTDMPANIGRLVDRLMLADAQWFIRNPSMKVCTRSYVAGEAWPHHQPLGSRVTVTLIGPRLRMRRFGDRTEVLDIDMLKTQVPRRIQ